MESELKVKIDSLESITNTFIKSNNTKVIFLDCTEEWAISALIFKGKPHLGVRWFDFPDKSWFIIPYTLENTILDVINLNSRDRKMINDFLLSTTNDILKLQDINTVIINRV